MSPLAKSLASYIPTTVTNATLLTKCCSAACAFTAVEMAVRAVWDVFSLCTVDENRHADDEKNRIRGNLSYHFSGAILYGMCAANFHPGVAAVGLACLAYYSATAEAKQEIPLCGQPFAKLSAWLVKIPGILDKTIHNLVAKCLLIISFPTNYNWKAITIVSSVFLITRVALPALQIHLPTVQLQF